jgi:uncharacterized membrane protein YbhN (UPF0104 family)
LLAILAARFDLGQAASLMGHASLPLLAATLTALLTANLLVALRWHLILSFASPSPGPVALLRIVFVGLFFNQVLPTGVGGDAVRAWRCSKLGIGLGATVRSILLDRAWGYTVVVTLFIAVLPSLFQVLPQARERAGVVAVLVAAIPALLALVSLDCLPRPLLRLRLVAPLAELSRDGRRLLMHPGRCGVVLGLSILTIGLTVVAFKFIGDSIDSQVSLGVWAMVVPPVTLIQLLPVSLAGWGVREMTLVAVLGSFGVPAEAALAISILLGLSMILVGLPGGLIWLTDWDLNQPRAASGPQSITAEE